MKKAGLIKTDYFIKFGKLKDYRKNIIGVVSGSSIRTSDERFLSYVTTTQDLELERKGFAYNIYNETTNSVVAIGDSRLNVYNLQNEYCGRINNNNTIYRVVFWCFIALIITFYIMFLMMCTTVTDPLPKEIIISEESGNVITDSWNVFGKTFEEKIIYPGRTGSYYFMITNTNKKDVSINLSFSENNDYKLAMVYRLSDQYNYLKGDDTKYVKVEELETEGVVIPRNSSIMFKLDWSWLHLDDNNDTQAGLAGNAVYTINIKIVAVY